MQQVAGFRMRISLVSRLPKYSENILHWAKLGSEKLPLFPLQNSSTIPMEKSGVVFIISAHLVTSVLGARPPVSSVMSLLGAVIAALSFNSSYPIILLEVLCS